MVEHEEQEEVRDEDFGLGTFDDMVMMLESIIHSIIPSADGLYELVGREDRYGIYVDIAFQDDNFIGLFLGRKKKNLDMMVHWIRAQQVFPADRYIHFTICKSDGTIQRFVDKNVFRIKKKDKGKSS